MGERGYLKFVALFGLFPPKPSIGGKAPFFSPKGPRRGKIGWLAGPHAPLSHVGINLPFNVPPGRLMPTPVLKTDASNSLLRGPVVLPGAHNLIDLLSNPQPVHAVPLGGGCHGVTQPASGQVGLFSRFVANFGWF